MGVRVHLCNDLVSARPSRLQDSLDDDVLPELPAPPPACGHLPPPPCVQCEQPGLHLLGLLQCYSWGITTTAAGPGLATTHFCSATTICSQTSASGQTSNCDQTSTCGQPSASSQTTASF